MAREGRKLTDTKMKELQDKMNEFCSEPGKVNFDDFCRVMGFESLKSQIQIIQGNEIHISSQRSIPGEKDIDPSKKSIPVLPLMQ